MKKNIEAVPGERLLKEAYLELMASELEDFNWDAILVYDRAKTNVIFRQDYIKRFSGKSWLPPVTFDGDSTATTIERVIDYRLDKPRVSFEKADLESSRLDLHMRVVGGKQLTIENPNNKKLRQVTRLKMADALNGPSLHARVSLDEVNVGLNDGRVGIDLSKGTQYYLTYADTPAEDAIGGEKMKWIFESWLGEQKIFELSRMPRTDNIMKPEFMAIRTQAAADSNLLGTASEGDGAVLVFVKMEGNESTQKFPASNYSYFLPGSQDEFSAVMLFAKNKLFDRVAPILMEIMEKEGISFDAKYENGVITATNGGRLQNPGNQNIPGGTAVVGVIGAVYSDQRSTNDHFGDLTLRLVNGDIQLRWNGGGYTNASFIDFDSKPTDRGKFVNEFSYRCDYSLLPDENGVISFRAKNKNYTSRMWVEGWNDMARAQEVLETGGYKKILDEVRMPELLKGFGDLDPQINLFLLHNLLFEGDQVFHTDSMEVPGPVAILGQLSPELTTFQVDPVETIVKENGKCFFKTIGSDVPVTWSVANLPNETGHPGTIIATTGEYTAPPRAELPDNHKRVIVTATAKSGGAVSRALVGIVNRTIGLDPIVMSANYGSYKYKVRASPLDPDEKITIRMSDGALGHLEEDPEADPDALYSKLYVTPAARASIAPGPEPVPAQWLEYRKSAAWTPEEELSQYLHIEQVIAEGSNGSKQEVEVLLLKKNVTNWFEFRQSGDGIQLEHWKEHKSLGDQIVPPEKTHWFKVKGAGTLVDGLYTPDPSADETYAVIVAIEESDDSYRWVLTILPIPFVGVERYLDMLNEDLK
ncbi:hypothetical protein BIW19_00295 [Pseudomonas putida]|nr:hypothetical protein BIW19_00295 [Pseudomonas putida]